MEICKPRSAAHTQEGSFHDIFQSDIVERGEEIPSVGKCWKPFFLQHFNIFSHASRTRSPKNDSRFSRFTSQSSPKDLSTRLFQAVLSDLSIAPKHVEPCNIEIANMPG